MKPEKMKRLVILTADAGFGHRSAANAVAAALNDRYADCCHVDVINPLEDRRTPFFLRDSQADYDKIVRDMPGLYRFGYDASDAAVPKAIVESALTVLLFEVMQDILRHYRPDAILITYPIYQVPLSAVFTLHKQYIPLLTVITDLATVHRIWFHPGVDACIVPTDITRRLAMDYGIPGERVHITGIPVNPNIGGETREKSAIRAELGWQQENVTFLAVGSRRVEHLREILTVLNHFGRPLQLVVVAGKDEELYHQLKMVDWHVPVHLYEYVSNLAPMMRAADGLISKAGGLIVTEALASGLPLVMVDVLPGQEKGNADYVISGGAGDLVDNPVKALEVFYHLLADDCELLHERARNALRLGNPDAAYQVADLFYQAAARGSLKPPRRKLSERIGLIDLLKGHGIHPGDSEDVSVD